LATEEENTVEESVEETPGVEYSDEPSEVDPRGAAANFKNAVATYIGQQGRLISLHSTDPGETGAGEISGSGYAKQLTTWGAASVVSGGPNDGRSQITGSTVTFSVPGATAINFYGVWSGASAGTPGNFLYGKALQPGATLTAAGQITVTPSHAYGLL
jgi:hypothetical protein